MLVGSFKKGTVMADETANKSNTSTTPTDNTAKDTSAVSGSTATTTTPSSSTSGSTTGATSNGSNTATGASTTSGTSSAGTSSTTGTGTGTDTASSPLPKPTEPTPEEQFPQYRYIKPVHPEILASKAFKASGLLPPKPYYYYRDLPNEEDYQWVGYMPKNGETFYSFFQKYGINPVEIRTWNPQTYERPYASYGGQYWQLRIRVDRLPHD